MEKITREQFGKLVIQGTEYKEPNSWELLYDGKVIGIYDGKTKYGAHNITAPVINNGETKYNLPNVPVLNLKEILNLQVLKRLYLWKDLFNDFDNFLDKALRKAKQFEYSFDLYAVGYYGYEILNQIQMDINNIKIDIELEEKKEELSNMSYRDTINITPPKDYAYNEYIPEINSLIKYFEDKVQKDEKEVNMIMPKMVQNANAQVDSTQKSEANSSNLKNHPKVLAVMAIYNDFLNDYQLLLDNGYIKEIGQELLWLKSKQSCADYFGEQLPNQSKKWAVIENLFSYKNLKNYYKQNGKLSKDYEELCRIKVNYRMETEGKSI